jgi:hypothetical protein
MRFNYGSTCSIGCGRRLGAGVSVQMQMPTITHVTPDDGGDGPNSTPPHDEGTGDPVVGPATSSLGLWSLVALAALGAIVFMQKS